MKTNINCIVLLANRDVDEEAARAASMHFPRVWPRGRCEERKRLTFGHLAKRHGECATNGSMQENTEFLAMGSCVSPCASMRIERHSGGMKENGPR